MRLYIQIFVNEYVHIHIYIHVYVCDTQHNITTLNVMAEYCYASVTFAYAECHMLALYA